MPKYDFQCLECGHEFEKTTSAQQVNEVRCLQCAGKTQKLLSVPAIVLKGGGFYKTDSRKKQSKKETKSCSTCS